jgi:IS30 family transposase
MISCAAPFCVGFNRHFKVLHFILEEGLKKRKTIFSLSVPLNSKRAEETSAHIINFLEDLPTKARKSITSDNGGEFAAHKDVCEMLQLQPFFCDPYSPWQKGSVENTNGRLRLP